MGINNNENHKFKIVIYTHNDYSDLWKPCFDRINKFFKNNDIIVITNNILEEYLNNFNLSKILYDDKLSYNKRLSQTLQQIESEYIIFLHEDMILYDFVDQKSLEYGVFFLKKNKNYHFIRLIKTGINSNLHLENDIYLVGDNDFKFSITPTIWDKKILIKICNELNPMNIWEFEINGCNYVKNNNINGCFFHSKNSKKRGLNHYDSKVFPHMCSAIFKGKWNMEYKEELTKMFLEYNIDVNLRGTIF